MPQKSKTNKKAGKLSENWKKENPNFITLASYGPHDVIQQTTVTLLSGRRVKRSDSGEISPHSPLAHRNLHATATLHPAPYTLHPIPCTSRGPFPMRHTHPSDEVKTIPLAQVVDRTHSDKDQRRGIHEKARARAVGQSTQRTHILPIPQPCHYCRTAVSPLFCPGDLMPSYTYVCVFPRYTEKHFDAKPSPGYESMSVATEVELHSSSRNIAAHFRMSS